MIRQAENTVIIEGILSEMDLNYGSYTKNGKTVEMINGTVTIRVVNDNHTLEIPVSVFANKITSRGSANPAYTNIEQAMKTMKSIAAVGEEQADGIRMTNCRVTMNEYYSQNDGHLISFPRIQGSFINRVNRSDVNPRASFEMVMVIKNMAAEVDRSGIETGRLKIEAYVPQFGNKVDIVTFFAENANVIDVIAQNWTVNSTVRAIGRVFFTSRTEQTSTEADFGEPIINSRTVRVSELLITGGAQLPLEGEFAYTEEDIQEGLATRATLLENAKNRSKASAPKPAQSQSLASKYGF